MYDFLEWILSTSAARKGCKLAASVQLMVCSGHGQRYFMTTMIPLVCWGFIFFDAFELTPQLRSILAAQDRESRVDVGLNTFL